MSSEATTASLQNPIVHFNGPSTFPGDYELTPYALSTYDIAADMFGTTTVQLPMGAPSFVVHDLQYQVGTNPDGSLQVGMRFIPVADIFIPGAEYHGQVPVPPDGALQWGNVVLDAYLRKLQGLGENDPIFAILFYMHPGTNNGTVQQLLTAGEGSKMEMSISHMGSYLGGGWTTNAPENYLFHQFSTSNYPAGVVVISFDGVPQAVLNRNAQYVDKVLNNGVIEPEDWLNAPDIFASVNVDLMFYRDWLLTRPYLRTDQRWFTYCSSHKSMVVNLAVNLPHNEAAFREIYGDGEGAALWEVFKQNFRTQWYREFTPADETHFTPLWKRDGYTPEQARPFKGPEEWDAYNEAYLAGTLGHYNGLQPLGPSQGMAWGNETTADMINDVVETYANFVNAGAVVAVGTIFALKEAAIPRLQITELQYLWYAMPIIQQYMMADAMVYAKTTGVYRLKRLAELYVAFGGSIENAASAAEHAGHPVLKEALETFIEFKPGPALLALWAMAEVQKNWKEVSSETKTVDEAYAWLLSATREDLDRARNAVPDNPKAILFYQQPAIAHRIAIGLFPSNKLVKVTEVGTLINCYVPSTGQSARNEIQLKSGGDAQ